MIDMHTHLLPGIDDGASSMEEARKMMQILLEQGITIAVCSPHFNPARETIQEFEKRRTNALGKMGYCGIELIPASETKLHTNLIHYPDVMDLCIRGTKYLLLELTFTKKWDHKFYQLIQQVITIQGIIPVIAHIERYPVIQKSPRKVKKLIKLGCVIQMNTTSLMNKKVKRKALWLIKKGFVDVLGSDCHNMIYRPPVYQEAGKVIEESLGREKYNQCIENARNIIRGELLFRHKILEQGSLSYSDFK